ncbi:hypothetical protein [Pseudomonas abyssi]|uniref:hypothetical protein n=1 Tax=Pseudomonas abyssi TaxID=170540 RepID=UPI003C79F51D
MRIRWSAMALALPLLLSGCSAFEGYFSGPEQRFSGLLERSGADYVLRECGSREMRPVQATAALDGLWAQTAQPGQTAIFAELMARQGDALVPAEVLRMQSHGRGCADLTGADAQWVALSYKPGWQATLDGRGLNRSEQGERVATDSVMIEYLPDGSLNAASLPAHRVQLWLYPQACQEPVSGDYFHMRATLVVDGEQRSGCAYRGRQASNQPPR